MCGKWTTISQYYKKGMLDVEKIEWGKVVFSLVFVAYRLNLSIEDGNKSRHTVSRYDS